MLVQVGPRDIMSGQCFPESTSSSFRLRFVPSDFYGVHVSFQCIHSPTITILKRLDISTMIEEITQF